jgi:serine/threonine-protein kinase
VSLPEGKAMGPTSPKYLRIAAVGQGGMADVWLVVAPGPAGFSKLLALKELKADLCDDPDFVDMFLAEARLAARLNHPNVVQTYEVGLDAERPGIVMEWLEGQPLHALLAPPRRAAVPLAAHVYVLAQVLGALDYAHEFRDFDGTPLGVVHRDVSPHNVFLTYDGQVKLMDFGIAKMAGVDGRTQAGVVKGKVGYVAPEQIAGARVDRRADVYSVGVMLWEALVGRRLTAGESRNVVFARRLQGVYEPVLALVPDAPPELAAAVDRAMALSPDDRYPTAATMRADLEAWLGGQRASGREVAALLGELFAEQRRNVRRLIEQQMRALGERGGGAGAGLPLVALAAPGEGGLSASGASTSVPSLMRLPTLTVPAMPPLDPGAGTQPMTQAMGGFPGAVAPAAAAAPGGARGRWWALGAAAALLGLGAFGWRAPRHAPPAAGPNVAAAGESTPTLPLGVPAPSGAAAEAAPGAVELSVRTQPAGARVTLDGRPLGPSPLTHRVARDGDVHTLRVSANGYRDEERPIAFSRDYAVEIALKPLTPSRPGRPAARPADEPPPPAPAAPERLKQPARGSRPIEESNPY